MERTPQQLREFAEHLVYEVEMVWGLTKVLHGVLAHDRAVGRRDLDWLNLPTRNAQVESFAVHSRALLDFFYEPPRVRPDDALARHYAPGWTPPSISDRLADVHGRVGKEVAHLTYARSFVADDAKDWQYGLIWKDLRAVIREFVLAASAELLPTTVATRIMARIQAGTVAGLDSDLALASAASATQNLTALQNSPFHDPLP